MRLPIKKVRLSTSVVFISAVLFLLVWWPSAPTIEWELDHAQSEIKFISPFLQASSVEGHFREFSGKATTQEYDFTGAQADVFIEANSLNTDNTTRDRHLKSEDFIAADAYPQITFSSTSMQPAGDGFYKLVGNLTIRGITDTVELEVEHWGTIQDENGDIRAKFKVTGEINRFDFNVDWSRRFLGGLVVGKMIRVECIVEFVTEDSEAWEKKFTQQQQINMPSLVPDNTSPLFSNVGHHHPAVLSGQAL